VRGGASPSQNALLGLALTVHTGIISVIWQTCSLPYP